MKRTIIFPHKPGSGGPGSFQDRFEKELKLQNWEISYANDKLPGDVAFVVGGTGRLFWLLKMKLKRVPIIYRLDGINWLHRKKAGKRDWKAFLSAEKSNVICKIIHAFLADYIVYQSEFVRDWWSKKGWRKRSDYSIVYNAVDLAAFLPGKQNEIAPRLICLEGYLDYTPYAIELINELNEKLSIKMEIYGGIKFVSERQKLSRTVNYNGMITKAEIPGVLANSIYLSLDINPACPNTVIEALACGAPVVAFETGSLSELVPENAGIIVPYGSDPWQLAYPDVDALAAAILKVNDNYTFYSANARKVAEGRYSIDDMTGKYLEIINKLKNKLFKIK
jgi:glycosyltransferase involved in cell wall biosynthesis